MRKFDRILSYYPELIPKEYIHPEKQYPVVSFRDRYKGNIVATFPAEATEDYMYDWMRANDTRNVAPTTTAYFDQLFKEQMRQQEIGRQQVRENMNERIVNDSHWRHPHTV